MSDAPAALSSPYVTPSISPGMPTSPRILSVAGFLVALAGLVGGFLGWKVPMGADTVVVVAGSLGWAVGLFQNFRAKKEHATGVGLLEEALRTMPPETREAMLRAKEDIQRRALLGFSQTNPPSRETLKVLTAMHPLSAAEQLAKLDPSAPAGLDRWSGRALRALLEAGVTEGTIGPISWKVMPDGLRTTIEGVERAVFLKDPESYAKIMGATAWLEASRNAALDSQSSLKLLDPPEPVDPSEPTPMVQPRSRSSEIAARCCEIDCGKPPVWWQGSDGVDNYSLWCAEHVPPIEPGEGRYRFPLDGLDAPVPRSRVPSDALLDDDGEPVSVSTGEMAAESLGEDATTERVAPVAEAAP